MGNCLKTQLKESVNNDNLDVLDYLCVRYDLTSISSFSSSYYLTISTATNLSAKVNARKGYIKNSNGDTLESPQTIPSNESRTFYFTPGVINIWDIEKKAVKMLRSNGLNVNSIQYMPNLETLYQIFPQDLNLKELPSLREVTMKNRSTLKGDISKLSQFTNLESIIITSCNVSGDIKNIGNLTQLTTLQLGSNSGIKGDIESFVAMQKISGRPTNTTGININYIGSGNDLTFIGENSYIRGNNIALTWEADGNNTVISVNNTSTIITVASDGTWTRVS